MGHYARDIRSIKSAQELSESIAISCLKNGVFKRVNQKTIKKRIQPFLNPKYTKDQKDVRTDELPNPVDRWLQNTNTTPDHARESRAMVERDVREDLSGADSRLIDGKLYFTHRSAIIVARKLRG